MSRTRRLESRSRYKRDFVQGEADEAAGVLYKTMLDRARARPEKLPNFQDITTVKRDFRGVGGKKAPTAKPVWNPAKYRPFEDKTENQVKFLCLFLIKKHKIRHKIRHKNRHKN